MPRNLDGAYTLLLFLVPFMAGICVADLWPLPGSLMWLAAAAWLLLVIYTFYYIKYNRCSFRCFPFSLMLLIYFLLGVGVESLQMGRTNQAWPSAKKMWRGFVTETRLKPRSVQCSVELTAVFDAGCWRSERRKVMVTVAVDSAAGRMVRDGDEVGFYARVDSLRPWRKGGFDYATWLRRKGFSGQAFAGSGWARFEGGEASHWRHLSWLGRARIASLRFRERLLEMYRLLPLDEAQRQLVAALTLGSRGGVDARQRAVFAQSGVSHVLALSGMHLGILVSLLLVLLRPLMSLRYGRGSVWSLLLLLIWGFVFLTGMSLSLMRAALMYSLWVLFAREGLQSQSVHGLALAAWVLLTLGPDSLFDVGFQLSFVSVFFLLVSLPLMEALAPRGRVGGCCFRFVFISLVAQLATAPLVAHYFQQLPAYFLPGNLVALPCVYVILGVMMLFLASGWWLWLQGVWAEMLGLVFGWMEGLLTFLADLPGAVIPLPLSAVGAALCYVAVGGLVLMLRRPVGQWILWRNGRGAAQEG